MLTLLVAALAATPASLDTLAKASSLIAFGRVTASRTHPQPLATVSIEFVIKGEERRSVEVAAELHIGARALFFLEAIPGSPYLRAARPHGWLGLSREQAGSFRVFPEHIALSRALLVKSKPHGYGGRTVPAEAVFSALGFKPRSLLETPSYRVISASCSPCSLDTVPSGPELDCGVLGQSPGAEACVKKALEGSRLFKVRQEWSGIDSGGVEGFTGRRGAVQRVWFDDDVTGGTRPQCSSAVFESTCVGLDWSSSRLDCAKTERDRVLCSEWNTRSEVLSEPRPLEAMPCGDENTCPKPLEQVSHLCRTHRDGSLWCAAE